MQMGNDQAYTIASVATAAPFPTDLVAMMIPQRDVRVSIKEHDRFTSEAIYTTSHRKLGETKRSKFEEELLQKK